MNSFEASSVPPPTEEEIARFEAAAAELLQEAGGALSLTEAAEVLRLDRQGLYDRIRRGEALGMMDMAGKILVPTIQFVTAGDHSILLAGIECAVRPFVDNHDSRWGALQWLIGYDPNLATTPIEALRQGRFDDVERAAINYIGADEIGYVPPPRRG